MRLLQAAEARRYDHEAMHTFGIPLVVLMENAGAAVAKALDTLPDGFVKTRPYVFVLGTGNNGADGLVAARHIVERGGQVRLYVQGCKEKRTPLFQLQERMVERCGLSLIWEPSLDVLREGLREAAAIVEGLVGTGLTGALRPETMQWIREVQAASCPVVAIDIPAGVHTDTGAVAEGALRATLTVTMVAPKVGLCLYPGKTYAGEVQVYPIGGPAIEQVLTTPGVYSVTADWVRTVMPVREPTSHKGTHGHVLLIGGQVGMWGAPILSACGAVHAGAGKTTIGTREAVYTPLMQKAPLEVMGAMLPPAHATAGAEAWRTLCADKDVVAIGPGLGRQAESLAYVEQVLTSYEGPLVMDADALYVVGTHWDMVAGREWPAILTPHVGEFSHMTGLSAKSIESQRVQVAREFATQHQVVLVLKGAPTVTAWPDGTVMVNTTGNPGMGTGGMGDVLTGIIAALVGQGLTPEEAATVGVYLHGASADRCAMHMPWGYTPTAVAEGLGACWPTQV